MSTVLITGARAPIALDLAQSFAAAGLTPHLADSISPWTARLSPIAKGRLHRLAPPRYAFDAFARGLADLVDRLDPKLIVPTCEEVFYVAEAGRRLGFVERVFAPSPEVLRRLHSKLAFADLAREAGLNPPTTRQIRSREGLALRRDRARDLVFKPEFSRFASHVLIRPRPDALKRLKPTPDAPWVAQDFVEGQEICIWSAAVNGEVRAFAAYRPKWRLGRSAGYYFEVDPDPALLEVAQKIAAATGATGQLSFDVIRKPKGGIAPIECNPRGVSGLHLFDADPRLALALLGEGPLVTPSAQARHLGPAMALFGWPQALVGGRLDAFAQDLKQSRDVLRRPGEPFASAAALLDAGRFALAGLSRGRSASGQSTDDIEWNGGPIG